MKLQVKSYLAGNPAIRLALNDDLVIGRQVQHAVAGRTEPNEHSHSDHPAGR